MNIVTGIILVVDDEPQIHRFLGPALTAAGYTPLRAERGDAALKFAAERAPDAILLDLGLPDLDGQEVLTRLRQFSEAPVIILSARDDEAGKIAALDAGANDYVEKPFSLGELLARLRAVLRPASPTPTQSRICLDGLEIDLAERRVSLAGVQVPLTNRQYDLLVFMSRNQGRVLTHQQLLKAVWGPAHTQDVEYLRVYVGQLRQKLAPLGHKLILTDPGIGYRMKASASA
jgi:two-component system KDP operon response regulator KdpE